MLTPIRFVMLGGFLGAGKTTLISQMARRYQAAGLHVCIVTNDQAAGLVDTELLRNQGLEVNEVAGSCFCCNFHGLTDAMSEFEKRERPDVILAEPVGSCTDLVATIAAPMMERLGEQFEQSPYAVVLKPSHGLKILNGQSGGFSQKAEYIFRKQLEEAEIILINRIDELPADQIDALESAIEQQYPGRQIIRISAKTGENLEQLETALQKPAARRESTMEVDYDVYAEGEAELGWLNATATISASNPMWIDSLALSVVDRLREQLAAADAEPAHLKVMCSSPGKIAVANLVSSDTPSTLSISCEAEGTELSVIVNARVRQSPDTLKTEVESVLAGLAKEQDAELNIDTLESFRPGRPVPTFRVQS